MDRDGSPLAFVIVKDSVAPCDGALLSSLHARTGAAIAPLRACYQANPMGRTPLNRRACKDDSKLTGEITMAEIDIDIYLEEIETAEYIAEMLRELRIETGE